MIFDFCIYSFFKYIQVIYMLEIFKIHYKNDNDTKKILIFCGNKKEYYEKHLDEILDEEDINNFNNGICEILLINDFVHKDDTVENLKLKIMLYDKKITFEEIYLYAYKLENLNIANILKTIETSKQDDKILINNIKSNVKDDIFKKFLVFDDDVDVGLKDVLYLENEKVLVSIPIGFKFDIENSLFYNSVCPFNIKSDNQILNEKSMKMNNDLLFEYKIYNNDIYLCDFSVKEFSKKIVEVYFPLLDQIQIYNYDELNKTSIKLREKFNKIIEKNTPYNLSTNLLYENYRDELFNYYYPTFGFKKIKLKIKSVNNIFVPLDVVFKTIHSNKKFPLIKLVMGNKIEKLFRLYSEESSFDGRKIPFLKKSEIMKVERQFGNHKGITIYVQHKNFNFYLIIHDNGNLLVHYESDNFITIKQLNEMLESNINEILLTLKNKFEKSGYKINFFTDINSENIQILDSSIIYKLEYKDKLKTKKLNDCLHNFFEFNSEKNIKYKRVKNYNEMIEKNSGFPMSIEKDKSDKNFHIINVEKLDNINYLDYIKVFLKAFADFITGKIDSDIEKFLCKNKLQKNKAIFVNEETEKEDKDKKELEKEEIEEDDEELDEDFFLVSNNKVLLDEDEEDEEDEDDEVDDDEDDDDDEISIPSLGSSISLDSNIGESLGGAKKGENRNYNQNRIQKYDKNLFLKFNSADNLYSRTCSAAGKRQPIILTREELNKIDENHRGSYSEVLEYSVDPNNQYYYICPRYWCPESNISLTEQQVTKENGELKSDFCPGKIMEFDDPKYHHKGDSDYIYNNPGFNKNSCIPCCFKISQKDKNKVAVENCKEQFLKTPDNSKSKTPIKSPKVNKNTDLDLEDEISLEYIQQPNKFPLEQNRFGFLPIGIQKFLINDLNQCGNKKNFKCLLRVGTIQDENQSFISTLATIYSYLNKTDTVVTNKEIKDKLINGDKDNTNKLNLDNFINYSNGNLISSFYKKEKKVDTIKYLSSELASQINRTKKKQNTFFKRCVNAYEQFISFLKSDTSFIDHTYLWDILCHPDNNLLFKKNINIIIFEIKDDLQDNYIELLCPTNHYSGNNFKTNSANCLIIKYKNLYEPVFYCEKMPGKTTKEKSIINITPIFTKKKIKTFNLNDFSNLLNNIKIIYENDENCGILSSKPNSYKFKLSEKTLRYSQDIYKKLLELNYSFESQIVNYNGKVIGLMVKSRNSNSESFMIPVYPSGISSKVKLIFIDNMSIINTYSKTKEFLYQVYIDSGKSIPCLPVSKVYVINDNKEFIVGIITESKQFIPVEPTINNEKIEENSTIKIEKKEKSNDIFVNNNDYFFSDAELFSIEKNNFDKQTKMYVKKIKLENRFYDCFRNFIRIQINKTSNIDKKKKLLEILESRESNTKKINEIDLIVKNITKDLIKFSSELDDNKIESLNIEENICFDEDFKILHLPVSNLITEEDNSLFYFERFYDEIMRFDYIKKFVFDSDSYLNLINENYKVNENEFLVPQSILTQKYFENLIPIKNHKNFNYDTAYPQMHIPYSNIYKLLEITDDNNELIENENEIETSFSKIQEKKERSKRCPNGFRRDPKTKKCVPMVPDDWITIEQDGEEALKSKSDGEVVLISNL